MLSNDRLRGTWHAENIGSHCQMTVLDNKGSLTSWSYQFTLSDDRMIGPKQADGISTRCQMMDWGKPDKLRTSFHTVRWLSKGNLTSWGSCFTLSDNFLQGIWQIEDVVSHCQMTFYREPDKLRMLLHTVRRLSTGNLTSWGCHFTLSDDFLQGTWQAHNIDSHHRMTHWGEIGRCWWSWFTRWMTKQGMGWLCWPPEVCVPQRCSPWSYSAKKKKKKNSMRIRTLQMTTFLPILLFLIWR